MYSVQDIFFIVISTIGRNLESIEISPYGRNDNKINELNKVSGTEVIVLYHKIHDSVLMD
ncbi:hypothetical protein THIOM_001873 [Candidatus Thiomargarita nelsonii]|uniref:Uncharacterized protein n=1 Tax=Candidatus Thiomargarita nelsonii TaxID=1003181 RepID=A0A176S2L2_9GAMM|nr:hypothetical protein THIOM_001873 [Candidatus Thiomargarita nelsonii]